jgi:hypothetical protein
VTAAIKAVEAAAQNALDQQALGVMLLTDIRAVFEAAGDSCDRLASSEIVARLVAFEERPSRAFGKRDDALTPRRVADMLRCYGPDRHRHTERLPAGGFSQGVAPI